MAAVSLPPVVSRYFELVNADRVDELMELFHPEAVVLFPMARPLQGPDQIRGFYEQVKVWYPQHRDEPVRAWESGGAVAIEIEFRGVTADGRPVEFRAVDLMDLVGGRIARLQGFYDSLSVLRQRGLTRK